MNLITIVAILTLSAIAFGRPAEPPETWQEHWFGHEQLIKKVYVDSDLAVYFDDDVDPSIVWPNTYLFKVWRYVKETYGFFGPEQQLYAIFHSGKYSGGHPSTYFDEHHDYRNVIDVGSLSTEAWISGQGNDLDIVTHEVAHIVEIASKNSLGSPAFPIWGDSKWAEIFNYDVYLHLGLEEDVTRWFNMMITSHDNFPREDTYWFRDFFYPIYNEHGGNLALNRFFLCLSLFFPKEGQAYSRDLNMGEFIHFWSAAAATNLKELATQAFGWTEEYENQFLQARIDFPQMQYD